MTDDETLSDEQLVEIRAKLDRTPIIPFTTDKTERGVARVQMRDLRWAVHTLLDLLAEVERRRAREAALLKIARTIDYIDRDATGEIITESLYITDCPLCHQRITGPVDHEWRQPPLPKLGHRNDCPVLQARALLGEETQP